MAKKPSVPIDGTFEPAPKDNRIWQEKLRDGGNDWINYLLGPHAQMAADAASFLPSQSIVDLLSGSSEVSKGVVNKNPWESGMGLVNMLTSGAPGPNITPAMILTLAKAKVSPGKIADLQKLQGSKDLFEIFDKEGAWLDPHSGDVKTMIGREQFPKGNDTPFTDRFYDEIDGNKPGSRGSLSQYFDLPAYFATHPEAINQRFNVKDNSPFVPSGTKGQYGSGDTFIYSGNIANLSPTGVMDDILKDAEATSFHELTHASQDMGGGLYEGTSDDYFNKFLDSVILSKSQIGSPAEKARSDELRDAYKKHRFINSVTGGDVDPTTVPFDRGIDFLSYLGHPLEREARAGEDMALKSLEDRAKNYLAGVDSTPAKHAYKSPEGLFKALQEILVTGKRPVPYIRKVSP